MITATQPGRPAHPPAARCAWRRGISGARLAWLVVAALCSGAVGRAQPVTDRDAYNTGTAKLNAQDFRAAEMLLDSAVRANNGETQPTALYNLGLTRFALGAEALEEGPDRRAVSRRAVTASTDADAALQEGLTAMQRGEQQALIRAYVRGHGARREVKEALKALREALDIQGTALSRWQRAAGDFHSAVELRPQDTDAAHNAEVMDRHIARLIDSIRQMQSMMQGLGEKMEGLEAMIEALRGRVPDDMGSPGPGEEGEDRPQGPEPGMEEGPGREGSEQPISPEDAERLLESFQLDRGRTLPMGLEQNRDPEDTGKGRNW